MPYLTAKLLDRANVGLVRARVGSRQAHVRRVLAEGRDQIAVAADERIVPLPLFRPEADDERGGHVRTTEWFDRDTGWTATRMRPRNASGRTDLPTVVLLHGWLATRVHLRVYRRLARPLVRSGLEVWLPRLPLHAERTPSGAISGERFLSADLEATAAAIRQAVAELLACGAWLRGLGRPAVAAWGISLGGWVVALSAAHARWDALCLWEPVVDPRETLARSPLAADIRAAIRQDGGVVESLESLDGLVPSRQRLQVSGEDGLLMLGVHDNVVYPDGARRAARAWGMAIHWLPHGHISLIASPRALRTSATFLASKLTGHRS